MPSYKGKISNDQCGIKVWINLPETDRDLSKKYRIDEHAFTAIIDTGAQRTCVGKKVVEALDLEPKGKTKMQSANETKEVNLYRVDIFIPIAERIPRIVQRNKIDYVENVNVKYWASQIVIGLDNNDLDILLGMDIIQTCNLFLAHGEFVLSY